MNSFNKLPVKRMVELEIWLLNNYPVDTNIYDVFKFFNSKFDNIESSYLMEAYIMPKHEIEYQLAIYQDSHPKMDEFLFIDILKEKYFVDFNRIMNRIRAINKIDKYIKRHDLSDQLPEVMIFDKLVRDNTPAQIFNNGDKPIFNILSKQEYWMRLLDKDQECLEEIKKAPTKWKIKQDLVDKLEVIKTMAEYNGFTLEEIIEAADQKREGKGGFSRKLFLKKVITDKKKNV